MVTVTAEAAGSSPVVPAIPFKKSQASSDETVEGAKRAHSASLAPFFDRTTLAIAVVAYAASHFRPARDAPLFTSEGKY